MTTSGQICKMSYAADWKTYCNMGQPYCNILQYAFCCIVSPLSVIILFFYIYYFCKITFLFHFFYVYFIFFFSLSFFAIFHKKYQSVFTFYYYFFLKSPSCCFDGTSIFCVIFMFLLNFCIYFSYFL